MPQLDPYLALLAAGHGDTLLFVDGELATIARDGASRPVTKQPVTAAQLQALLREIAPTDSQTALAAGAATFRYEAADNGYLVRAGDRDGRFHAAISLEARGAARATPAAPVSRATPAAADAAPAAGATLSEPLRRVSVNVPAVSGAAAEAAKAEIDELLRLMVERKASDLHLRCGEPPILRHDGEMVRIEGRQPLTTEGLEAMLQSIMPDRNRNEYASSNDTDFAYEIEGVARFRANGLRDRKGAAAVFRQIPAQVVTVEQMGITPEVRRLCSLTKGLVLVTGPTGSGKSTTLCSLIDLVNRERNDHVITIEDPIEFVHPNKNCIITQRQVGVHTGSFKSALRAALREDPDIILVGELRDLETVSIAIETAETGHLVFGTLHTTTAASTIDRIIDQFPADRQSQIRVMLSESLRGVIAQTLCKKVGGGRVAALEVLIPNGGISNLIREGKTFQINSMMQVGKASGMVTLNDALADLVRRNLITAEEAMVRSVDKGGLETILKRK